MERKLLLLGMLRENRLYGYQINELIEAHLGSSIQLTKPTAYRFLNQMADEGWISFEEEQAGNRPTRRVYAITTTGEATFQKMLRDSLGRFEPAAAHSTIGFAFMDALSPEEVLTLLERRRAIIEKMRDDLTIDADHQGGFATIISHQIHHLDAELAWLNEVIEQVH